MAPKSVQEEILRVNPEDKGQQRCTCFPEAMVGPENGHEFRPLESPI